MQRHFRSMDSNTINFIASSGLSMITVGFLDLTGYLSKIRFHISGFYNIQRVLDVTFITMGLYLIMFIGLLYITNTLKKLARMQNRKNRLIQLALVAAIEIAFILITFLMMALIDPFTFGFLPRAIIITLSVIVLLLIYFFIIKMIIGIVGYTSGITDPKDRMTVMIALFGATVSVVALLK